MRHRLLASAALALSLTLPVAARAAETTDEAAAPASPTDQQRGQRGLELTLRGSTGAASSDSPVQLKPGAPVAGDLGTLVRGASPYGIGFIGQAMIGLRLHPLISFGLRGGLRTSSASDLDDGSTNLARSSWDAGFYLRAYPLVSLPSLNARFEPWLGVGLEYMRDEQSFQRAAPTNTGSSVTADVTFDHHAVVVPLSLGVDYRIHPRVALGPSFEYAIAMGVDGCTEYGAPGYSSVRYCSGEGVGKQVLDAKGYGVWSAGLDLRVTLF
jgi:opacity protein-like surface antigen